MILKAAVMNHLFKKINAMKNKCELLKAKAAGEERQKMVNENFKEREEQQKDTLDNTEHKAIKELLCKSSKTMQALIILDLIKSAGWKSCHVEFDEKDWLKIENFAGVDDGADEADKAVGEERQKMVDEDFKIHEDFKNHVDNVMLDACYEKKVLNELDLNMSMFDKCSSCLKLKEANLLKIPIITLYADKDGPPEYCMKCYQDERKKFIELKKAFDYRIYLDAAYAMKRTPMSYSDWFDWVRG